MAAKPTPKAEAPKEAPAKAEPQEKATPLILTQAEHAKLSDKEKSEFRAKNGTISNQ